MAVAFVHAQPRQASVQEKVIANYPLTSEHSQKPIQLSPLGGVLLQETRGSEITFTLSDANNTSMRSSVLVAYESDRPRAWFSPDGRKVLCRMRKAGRLALRILDVSSQTQVELKDAKRDIGTASISTKNNRIAFRMGDNDVIPEIYVADADGLHARLLTEGIGGDWSANGEWIAVLKPTNMNEYRKLKSSDPKARKKLHHGVTIDWTLWLYSPEGRALCELTRARESPNEWIWSPSSDRILSLRGNMNSVVIESSRRFGVDTSVLSELRNPSWAPDGKSIVYVRSILGASGHNFAKDEVWIASVDGNDKMKLHEVSSPSSISDLVWVKNGTIILVKDDSKRERSVSIVELSSNGKSFKIWKNKLGFR
jgi:dipeptidyl aminopeptidase/acylaminoacyl peptidase